jgi:uncharacterized membrane protein
VLRKNCTLSPKQFGSAIIFVGGLSLVIAILWAVNGIWFILPFACIECIALLVAFCVYSRHATDFEKVVLTKSEICLEREIGGMSKSFKIPRDWVRARFERNEDGGLVFFKSGNTELRVGRFVSIKKRALFFDEIKGFL